MSETQILEDEETAELSEPQGPTLADQALAAFEAEQTNQPQPEAPDDNVEEETDDSAELEAEISTVLGRDVQAKDNLAEIDGLQFCLVAAPLTGEKVLCLRHVRESGTVVHRQVESLTHLGELLAQKNG